MAAISLIRHAPGAPGLRLLGLGPKLLPSKGKLKLQLLLNEHSFWAANRDAKYISKMLANSTAVVSLWRGKRMVGFGRATSDTIYRAVLWDVVIAKDLQGQGLGKRIVKAILNYPTIKKAEKVYLMTTQCAEFYQQIGFDINHKQTLMLLNRETK